MQKKIAFFAGAVVCLLIVGWGYYQYQKPRAGAADFAPAYRLAAAQLYDEYSTNEAAADEKYNGKVLEVTGVVKEVQATAQGANVLLAGGDAGGVNCSLAGKPDAGLKIGTTAKIKGRCAGFLLDVNLVDAVPADK